LPAATAPTPAARGGLVDLPEVAGGQAARADHDRDAPLDRGQRDLLGVLVGGELDEHVDAVERLADGRVHRDAERLSPQGGAEVLAGAGARDRAAERDVRGGERPVGDGSAGPAGRARDGEIDRAHGRIPARSTGGAPFGLGS
jgi:hypothetical protein